MQIRYSAPLCGCGGYASVAVSCKDVSTRIWQGPCLLVTSCKLTACSCRDDKEICASALSPPFDIDVLYWSHLNVRPRTIWHSLQSWRGCVSKRLSGAQVPGCLL